MVRVSEMTSQNVSVQALIWIYLLSFAHHSPIKLQSMHQDHVVNTIFTLIEMNNDKMIQINLNVSARNMGFQSQSICMLAIV